MTRRGLPPLGPLAALQFLTRVPIRLRSAPDTGAAVAWFAVIGALIGAAVGGVAFGLWHVLAPLPTAAVAVAAGLLITGAFHEDGLGDTADAFGGGTTVERRLEIMKDSRHGTYGVAAMCSSIVIRVAALASVPSPGAALVTVLAGHTMGRAAAVGMAGFAPMSTHPGLGADAGRATSRRRAVAGMAAGLAITALATGWWVGPMALAAVVSAVAVGILAVRKVGGISGDILGAAEQVAECAVMLTAGALATHHGLHPWLG